MEKIKEKSGLGIAVLASVLGFFPSCTSTTVIRSEPSGARVFLDDEYVGPTPYTMSDKKIVGTTTVVRLELPGYVTQKVSISRTEEFDVAACIGGFFFLVPFLWIQGYKPDHSYVLSRDTAPAESSEPEWVPPPVNR